MVLDKIIERIEIKNWYQILTIISGIILIFALFTETKYIPNKNVILISLGLLIFSLGEWMQRATKVSIREIGYNKGLLGQEKIRKMNFYGFLLNILGLFIVYLGLKDLL